ncbi:MAG: Tyrosine-specific transport protein [Candidatus Anoxychlamydiales bacterium]|nr:Tyrosine-specific transport protein [Candidatus Anoxychlamydiales bacterium]
MKIKEIISASLLIAGTMIGAGMLAIPLVTAKAGFIVATIITILVWAFMLITGLLFLEATLWMDKNSNILSMSKRFLHNKGRAISGIIFIFLYYCLMVAYFAAGAPILASFIEIIMQIKIDGIMIYLVYGLIFASIVGVGIKFINRINYILMCALIISYITIIFAGSSLISLDRLFASSSANIFISIPILFTSFGFHNVIPSLTFHFKENVKVMKYAIIIGSVIPLIIYIVWQLLIIGSIPLNLIENTLKEGKPITDAIQSLTNVLWIKQFSKIFSLFAIITSMLGVSFSVVDFLGDGFKLKRHGKDRFFLILLTFIPPFILASLDPSIFVVAIGVAGGFGEAYLNGILPALLVYKGRYVDKIKAKFKVFGGKFTLFSIILLGSLVILLEFIFLIKKYFV